MEKERQRKERQRQRKAAEAEAALHAALAAVDAPDGVRWVACTLASECGLAPASGSQTHAEPP